MSTTLKKNKCTLIIILCKELEQVLASFFLNFMIYSMSSAQSIGLRRQPGQEKKDSRLFRVVK